MELFFFYFFAILIFVSTVMVISVRNPIHSVLFLMLVFCNATGLLLLLGCEYLAFIFVMVYVGAIAVLFLFVVMMLNIKLIEWNEFVLKYLPISGFLWALVALQMLWIYYKDFQINLGATNAAINWNFELIKLSNLEVLGTLLYTEFGFSLIIASLVLLVAMVGAIVLTMYSRSSLRRQSIIEQTKVTSLNYIKLYNKDRI